MRTGRPQLRWNTGSGLAHPLDSAWPNASNTGTSGTLSNYTGSSTFSTPNQTISNQLIQTNGISVTANNVTFSNCKFVYTGVINTDVAMVFIAVGVTGTTLLDCEIDGQDLVERAIKGYDDIVCRRCNIHHSGNGIEVATKVTATDNYIHDIHTPAGQTWHADGIQTGEGAVDNVFVKHNTILLTGDETGAINMIDNTNTLTYTNITVDNNLMAGGGYTIYIGAGTLTNVSATNNHLSTRYFSRVGFFNAWYNTTGFPRTGNVIDETGASANDNSF